MRRKRMTMRQSASLTLRSGRIASKSRTKSTKRNIGRGSRGSIRYSHITTSLLFFTLFFGSFVCLVILLYLSFLLRLLNMYETILQCDAFCEGIREIFIMSPCLNAPRSSLVIPLCVCAFLMIINCSWRNDVCRGMCWSWISFRFFRMQRKRRRDKTRMT